MSQTIRIKLPKPHRKQRQMLAEAGRFNVLKCGRRFGKTLLGRVLICRTAIDGYPAGWFAPSYKYLAEPWRDIIATLGPLIIRKDKTERRIELLTGGVIDFWTMEDEDAGRSRKYKRVILDEAAMVKGLDKRWRRAIRPTLTDYRGDAWWLSSPKGPGFFEDQFRKGQTKTNNWRSWRFGTIDNPYISPEEIEEAKADLDALTFAQEYLGETVSYEGLAYYAFKRAVNLPPDGRAVTYIAGLPLIWCFDFNRTPGVAVVCQEQPCPNWVPAERRPLDNKVTACIGEVYLEHNSNTERVCDELMAAWLPVHESAEVHVYGDATGGARKSVGVVGDGSDWALVQAKLKPKLGHRARWKYGLSNPAERERINAVNTRLRSADGRIHSIIDAIACPYLLRDMEGVTVNNDGAIEKEEGTMLTHVSDSVGYYITEKFPAGGPSTLIES